MFTQRVSIPKWELWVLKTVLWLSAIQVALEATHAYLTK